MRLERFANPAETAEALASVVAENLRDAIDSVGKASLAVPGGSTPTPFLKALSKQPLAWSKVTVTTTDERRVPADHERSNSRLVRETLLHNEAASAQFLSLNEGDSLKDLNDQLSDLVPVLDVCVLGMGEDGHTASLFPGVSGDLLKADYPAMAGYLQPPGNLEPRISLTARALLQAKHVYILIHGASKQQVLEQALGDDDIDSMPVRLVLQQAASKTTTYLSQS